MIEASMIEENKEIYGRALVAAKYIEAAARNLLSDIGYWGEDDTTDEDRIGLAERHFARLQARAKEMALALADLRRVIYEEGE